MLQNHETDRLLLMYPQSRFSELLLDFLTQNKDFFEPYEPVPPANYYTSEYQAASLQAENLSFVKGSYLRFYLFLKTSPSTLVGTISFYHIYGYPYNSCNLGYKVGEAFSQQGYATEALSFLLPYVMKEYGICRVEADVRPENAASLKLLKKLHFQKEGVARGAYEISGKRCDHIRFSILSQDLQS